RGVEGDAARSQVGRADARAAASGQGRNGGADRGQIRSADPARESEMSIADENPKGPKRAAAADPGATPRGEGEPGEPGGPGEPQPQPKQKDKQKDKPKEKQKGKKSAEVQKGAPAEPEGPPPEPGPPPRLHEYYEQKVRAKLAQQFGLKNPHEVPKLVKIVLNVGMGDATKNAKGLDAAVAELAAITGQQPVVTRAKKAIANRSEERRV